jgi:hypothetical protein
MEDSIVDAMAQACQMNGTTIVQPLNNLTLQEVAQNEIMDEKIKLAHDLNCYTITQNWMKVIQLGEILHKCRDPEVLYVIISATGSGKTFYAKKYEHVLQDLDDLIIKEEGLSGHDYYKINRSEQTRRRDAQILLNYTGDKILLVPDTDFLYYLGVVDSIPIEARMLCSKKKICVCVVSIPKEQFRDNYDERMSIWKNMKKNERPHENEIPILLHGDGLICRNKINTLANSLGIIIYTSFEEAIIGRYSEIKMEPFV